MYIHKKAEYFVGCFYFTQMYFIEEDFVPSRLRNQTLKRSMRD